MKLNLVTSGILLAFASGQAIAQLPCPPNSLTAAALVTTLSGKYACAKRAPGNPATDFWNELHQGTNALGGPILDYKRGPGHPVDPSKVVGSYAIGKPTPNAVTYVYSDASGTSGPFSYFLSVVDNQGNPELPGFLYCNVATGERIPAIISSTPTHAFCTAP